MEKVIISFEIQEMWIQDRDIAFFKKKTKQKKTFQSLYWKITSSPKPVLIQAFRNHKKKPGPPLNKTK